MTSQQQTLRTIAFFAPVALAVAVSVAVGAAFLLTVPEGNLGLARTGDSPHP
jgi:hypothetical protein